jgi:SAM-dependent methyltransferase
MYGGRLLASEAACQRLKAKATVPLDDPACIGSKRIRVLDIGGTSCASWAWNAALEWPNVKIYTVITKEQSQSQRPSGKPKPEAPNNHRTVSVPHLWQLPFRSGHFDVISARSLHVLLKNNPVPGVPEIDEWDLTLRECQRVLKPGGFIDYMIMDSTIAHAGPRGDAMSVEFGFELHRRGYEREAARSWLRRLKKEGFVGVKRAWVFMPMGRKPPKEVEENAHGFIGEWKSWRQGAKPFVPAPRPISEVSTISKIVKQYMDVEAVQGPVGSTEDVADLTGLLGARMWEEWLVKVRAESGRERSRWLEGVDEVIEEGKENGSGWKVLIGWARKPKPEKGKKAERAEITVAVEDLEELSPTSEECTEMGMIPMVIQE